MKKQSKQNSIKGSVIELKNDQALVRFKDGDERWFDNSDKQFAIGGTVTALRTPIPSNRETLFAYIKTLYRDVKWGLATWPMGTAKRKGKLASGASLTVYNVAEVFGTEHGKQFFVHKVGEKNALGYQYKNTREIEAGVRHITSLVNESLSSKKNRAA